MLRPAAAHGTDEPPTKGTAVSPSYSTAAVTEFARSLSANSRVSLCRTVSQVSFRLG